MKYISTRNSKKTFSFKDVFLNALAPDGGLFVPQNIPFFSIKELNELKKLSYNDLAAKIIIKFCSGEFEENELKEIVEKSYKSFRSKETVILKKYEDIYLLELFHGPTLAFKDIALQVIGNMYEKFLLTQKNKINIVVATSGDTGSAAINAIKGRNKLNIFVLHPQNKISEVQRKLMTTVKENNVFNIAVKGNFDDCQNLVKSMFVDNEFKNKINMSGVNSINWARIIGQIPYYFYATAKLNLLDSGISFCVPSGNFGNAYACYVSKIIGLPVRKIIIGSNRNDVLTRFFTGGSLKLSNVVATLSPSMDIQISSNLERYLFEIFNRSGSKTAKNLESLRMNGRIDISKNNLLKAKKTFEAYKLDDNGTLKNIKKVYNDTGKIIDPHSSVGFYSALEAG